MSAAGSPRAGVERSGPALTLYRRWAVILQGGPRFSRVPAGSPVRQPRGVVTARVGAIHATLVFARLILIVLLSSELHPRRSTERPLDDNASGLATRASLVRRLRDPTDPGAWEAFTRLYGPFLYRLCRRAGLGEADAADATQHVFARVLKYARFRRRPAARSVPGLARQTDGERGRGGLGTAPARRPVGSRGRGPGRAARLLGVRALVGGIRGLHPPRDARSRPPADREAILGHLQADVTGRAPGRGRGPQASPAGGPPGVRPRLDLLRTGRRAPGDALAGPRPGDGPGGVGRAARGDPAEPLGGPSPLPTSAAHHRPSRRVLSGRGVGDFRRA